MAITLWKIANEPAGFDTRFSPARQFYALRRFVVRRFTQIEFDHYVAFCVAHSANDWTGRAGITLATGADWLAVVDLGRLSALRQRQLNMQLQARLDGVSWAYRITGNNSDFMEHIRQLAAVLVSVDPANQSAAGVQASGLLMHWRSRSVALRALEARQDIIDFDPGAGW